MPPSDELPDVDFDAQLRGLFEEAELVLEGRSAAGREQEQRLEAQRIAAEKALAEKLARDKEAELKEQREQKPVPPPEPVPATPEAPPAAAELPKGPATSIPQMLRPMVLGLAAVTRATGENSNILQRLDKAATESADAHQALPQLVKDLQVMLEQKNKVNQRMFDALHEELKGYKDGFLLESVHRPIIRDLITLYDDLAELQRQMGGAVAEHSETKMEGEAPIALLQRMRTMEMNMEHHLEFIIEVLARLEVTQLPIGEGKLDKRTQRAVAVEMAEDPDDDTLVVRTVKRGFLWKERVLRAEEVVMKKWKEGFLVALAPASQN